MHFPPRSILDATKRCLFNIKQLLPLCPCFAQLIFHHKQLTHLCVKQLEAEDFMLVQFFANSWVLNPATTPAVRQGSAGAKGSASIILGQASMD